MKIVLILLLIIILVFTLFLETKIVENFDQNIPTPIPLPIRVDGSCSDPNQVPSYDRFNNTSMELLGLSKIIPPSSRNNGLTNGYPDITLRMDINQICINDNSSIDKKGNKIFIDTGKQALKNDGTPYLDNGNPYNLVDMYCCKGERYTPPDSSGATPICLSDCPKGYSIPANAVDRTVCYRDDKMCAYSSDLSANITQNWLNTCAKIYKKNLDTTTTISSIINVVSTFSTQTEMATTDYNKLHDKIITLSPTRLSSQEQANYADIGIKYNTLKDLQTTINQKLNQLKTDKAKFDMMFNQFGCSNYMF